MGKAEPRGDRGLRRREGRVACGLLLGILVQGCFASQDEKEKFNCTE